MNNKVWISYIRGMFFVLVSGAFVTSVFMVIGVFANPPEIGNSSETGQWPVAVLALVVCMVILIFYIKNKKIKKRLEKINKPEAYPSNSDLILIAVLSITLFLINVFRINPSGKLWIYDVSVQKYWTQGNMYIMNPFHQTMVYLENPVKINTSYNNPMIDNNFQLVHRYRLTVNYSATVWFSNQKEYLEFSRPKNKSFFPMLDQERISVDEISKAVLVDFSKQPLGILKKSNVELKTEAEKTIERYFLEKGCHVKVKLKNFAILFVNS